MLVIRATSLPQRSQYWRSPQTSTSFEAIAFSNGNRPCTSSLTETRAGHSSPLSQPASPHLSQIPEVMTLTGSLPVRSAVLIATSSRSSWLRSALRTFQTCLKSEPDSTASSARFEPDGTTTGTTTYPYCLPSERRITRPTACTTSICERFGSMNSTASNAGTSTPSVRHLALVTIRHRWLSPPCWSQAMVLARSNAFFDPSTWRISH